MNLNDYCREVHKANAKWWTCLACNNTGEQTITALSVLNYGKEDSDGGTVRVKIKCPNCSEGKLRRNIGELLMLCTSELAEALEGDRKGLMDDKLPHRKMFEVELADTVIRILDICGGMGLDLEGAYREKMAYNAVRADHKPENRLAPGGKKY